jgi:transcriptional regulator with XRE-family HTH domain
MWYHCGVLSASLIVQARRTAGLSQRELARRLGVAHPLITRWEKGHAVPSLERVREVVAACGLELTLGIARGDDSYDHDIRRALALPPAARLDGALRAADQMRAIRASTRGAPEPVPLDAVSALRALHDAGAVFVLAGEVAEVLHGSPLVPVSGVVTIVPRAGERARLDAAVRAVGGRAVGEPATSPVDADERWQLDRLGVELLIAPAPPATRGYTDLARDADVVDVDGVPVTVASLVDLLRVAEASASTRDRARTIALRRTLELANDTDEEESLAA